MMSCPDVALCSPFRGEIRGDSTNSKLYSLAVVVAEP